MKTVYKLVRNFFLKKAKQRLRILYSENFLISSEIQTKRTFNKINCFLDQNTEMHLSEEASRPKYKFSNIPEIENLSTGPIQSFRGCTDPLCYILFLIITVYFIGVSSVALFLGEVDLIGAPYDPNHRACGVDSEAIDYPYIYFVTPSSDSSGNYLYRTVCLKECPSNIGSNVYATTLDCLTNNVVTTCSFKAHPANESVLYYNTVPCILFL